MSKLSFRGKETPASLAMKEFKASRHYDPGQAVEQTELRDQSGKVVGYCFKAADQEIIIYHEIKPVQTQKLDW